jgi:hypothetical protein
MPMEIRTRLDLNPRFSSAMDACDMLQGKLIRLDRLPKLTEVTNKRVCSTICCERAIDPVSKLITVPPPLAWRLWVSAPG